MGSLDRPYRETGTRGFALYPWRVLCVPASGLKVLSSKFMETTKEKKPFFKQKRVWVVGALLLLFIIIGASSGDSKKVSVPAQPETTVTNTASGTNTKTESTPTAKTSVPDQAPATQQTLLDISGSGTKTTQKFTAAGDWDLNWSYDCSNFGYAGNFAVMIYDGDGSMSYKNALINQSGKSGTDVEHYHNGGTYYLVVNSVCKWKMNVKG